MTVYILGIESSCDETAAAVVADGQTVLSSQVESQILEHAPFGGVVPEIAGRSHLRRIIPVIDAALEQAELTLADISGIAVTTRPGLIGSLLVGLSAAKGIAFAHGLPLIGVHHIEAHAYAAIMAHRDIPSPHIALVVSGGHTALYRVNAPHDLEQLARTRDDAAGEAFDKVAAMLGLPYPGGPSLSALACEGNPSAIRFPRFKARDGSLGFSFSGLKTAVLYHLRGQDALARTPEPDDIPDRADVAASFQEAAVDALVAQTLAAAKRQKLDTVVVAGGVACNTRLREKMHAEAQARGLRAHFPAPKFCTDNAAMIAGLGFHLLEAGEVLDFSADASPR